MTWILTSGNLIHLEFNWIYLEFFPKENVVQFPTNVTFPHQFKIPLWLSITLPYTHGAFCTLFCFNKLRILEHIYTHIYPSMYTHKYICIVHIHANHSHTYQLLYLECLKRVSIESCVLESSLQLYKPVVKRRQVSSRITPS